MNRQELLKRYKTYEENPFAKKQRKKKGPKHSTTTIIDDGDDWGKPIDDEDGPQVAGIDFESQFKKQDDSWNVIQEGQDSRKRSPSASPSLSPDRSRKSVSVSPVRRRRSPSESPKRRTSPSPSPERPRRSPSPSPDRSHKHQESRIQSSQPDNIPLMSDGTKAGLNTGKELKAQLQKQPEMPDHGKHAETVYRDKTGRKIDMAAEKAAMLAEKRRLDEIAERKMEWGRGLVQTKEIKEREKQLEAEKNRGLAVYADDEDRNERLKEVVRWGDTMATVALTKKKSKKIGYQGAFPPNRYGIRPGYRWDGVDRSNGWEIKVFRAKYQDQEAKNEYHRWATEDM